MGSQNTVSASEQKRNKLQGKQRRKEFTAVHVTNGFING